MAVKCEKINYKGLEDSLCLSNGIVELIIPTKLGIRILSYKLVGGENVFANIDSQIAKHSEDKWFNFGGHRLWHSPEVRERTYEVDGGELLSYSFNDNELVVSQVVDPVSRIAKTMSIKLSEDSSRVVVSHTLTNCNAWQVNMALWAITVLKGGFNTIQVEQAYDALLPNRNIALWPYARMNDSRVYWGDRIISVSHNEKGTPFKIGAFCSFGKAINVNDKTVFSKKFDVVSTQGYPDFNCNYECYTNNEIIESESLTPLIDVLPNGKINHTEVWELKTIIKNIDCKDEKQLLELF